MNISNEIINILDDLGKRFGMAIDWSNKNIAPYLEELCDRFINWQIVTSVVWLVAATLALIISVFIIVKGFKWLMTKDDIYDELYFGGIVVGAILGVICLLIIGTQISDICRCVYMPELEIYNYISNHF